MVRPGPGHKGMTPVRSGQKLILGFDGSGDGRYYVAPRGMGGAKRATWYSLDEAGWASAWRAFEQAEPGNAAEYLRRLQPEPPRPARPAPAVPLLTISSIPGQEITEVLGLVIASSVMSRSMISDLGSDIQSMFGGNLEGIERAIAIAIAQARQAMYDQARQGGRRHHRSVCAARVRDRQGRGHPHVRNRRANPAFA